MRLNYATIAPAWGPGRTRNVRQHHGDVTNTPPAVLRLASESISSPQRCLKLGVARFEAARSD
jgi:hypothetical protein